MTVEQIEMKRSHTVATRYWQRFSKQQWQCIDAGLLRIRYKRWTVSFRQIARTYADSWIFILINISIIITNIAKWYENFFVYFCFIIMVSKDYSKTLCISRIIKLKIAFLSLKKSYNAYKTYNNLTFWL